MSFRDIPNIRGRYVKSDVLREFLLSQASNIRLIFKGMTFRQCRYKLYDFHVILDEDGKPIIWATAEDVKKYAKDKESVELANNYVDMVREELFDEILKG